jgi:hypothetical protein
MLVAGPEIGWTIFLRNFGRVPSALGEADAGFRAADPWWVEAIVPDGTGPGVMNVGTLCVRVECGKGRGHLVSMAADRPGEIALPLIPVTPTCPAVDLGRGLLAIHVVPPMDSPLANELLDQASSLY